MEVAFAEKGDLFFFIDVFVYSLCFSNKEINIISCLFPRVKSRLLSCSLPNAK